MSTTHFREISVTARSTGKCGVCGKNTKRTKRFWMTENPFNRNPDGTVRTPDDIRQAISVEIEAWVPDHDHAGCA